MTYLITIIILKCTIFGAEGVDGTCVCVYKPI